MFFVELTRWQRLRHMCSWPYLRQVGPMYRLTCWWLTRKYTHVLAHARLETAAKPCLNCGSRERTEVCADCGRINPADVYEAEGADDE